MVQGMLPSHQKILVMVDSGASKSLISHSTVMHSKFLSELPKIKTDHIKFQCANGNFMYSKYAIRVPITLQNHKIEVTALAVESLGSIDFILASKSLKEMNCTLDFGNNMLKFKTRSILLKASKKVKLQPHDTKVVELIGKLPYFMRQCDALIRTKKFLQKLTPEFIMARANKGRIKIVVTNNSDKLVKISNEKALACIDLKSHTYNFEPIENYMEFQNSNMTFNKSSPHSEKIQNQNACLVTDSIDRDKIFKEKTTLYPHLDKSDSRLRMTDSEIIERDIKVNHEILNTPALVERCKKLLHDKKECFSLHDEIGTCNDCEIKIKLHDDKPFMIRPYTVSPKEKEMIEKEMKKLESQKIIEKAFTPYSSPAMLINKPNGEKRCVVNLIYLNTKVHKYNLPVPLVKEAIQIIGNSECTIFSKIDMKSAFWSLKLQEESQQYFGISTYAGGSHYKFKRLPQGFINSAQIWQDKINEYIQEIPDHKDFSVAIADDILIFSKTVEEHFEHLDKIFSKLAEKGLKAALNKCDLFKISTTYMGYKVLIKDGRPCITPLKSKTEAITKLDAPKTKTQVKQFAGCVNFLASYLPKLQLLLNPIYKLVRKDRPFVWTEEHQTNFDEIKKLLTSPPILTLPRKTGKLKLYCDSSKIGTGSSLFQEQDGEDRLLSYHSKIFNKSAQNYSISELELSGIYVAVMAHKHILTGTSFEVYTDHSALVHLMKSKQPIPTNRMKRLIEKLSDFSFTLHHMAGKKMVISDFLSRNPCPGDTPDGLVPLTFTAVEPETLMFTTVEPERLTFTAVEDAQKEYAAPVTTRSKATRENITIPNVPWVMPTNKRQPKNLPQRSSEAYQPTIPTTPLPETPVDIQENQHTNIQNKQQNTQSHHTFRHSIPIEEEEITIENEEPPERLFKQHSPLIPDIKDEDILRKRIPKQTEIDAMMKIIKRRVLQDYHLPVDARELLNAQKESPHFKEIYQYLNKGTLPVAFRNQKKIINMAENFVLIKNILFKLQVNKKKDDCKIALCIPDEYCLAIIEMYHGSLLGHLGITKTFQTIRQKYYIPSLFDKLIAYIRSCKSCQEMKHPKNNERHFTPRIPYNYKPFKELAIDIKYMVKSRKGFSLLLVCVDPYTRYVLIFPMRDRKATTVAEILLRKIIYRFGVCSSITYDEDSSFLNSIMEYIHKTLNIKQIFVSPENHQSNVSERYIQTIGNFIVSRLQDTASEWDDYIEQVEYSINSFAMPYFDNHSPHFLMFGREPNDLSMVKYDPLEDTTLTYTEYADLLRKRAEFLKKTVMELQEKVQKSRASEQAKKVRSNKIWKDNMIVYLLAPHNSTLGKTNSRKIKLSYIGPLILKERLDDGHCILSDLTGRILRGTYHTNRLKVGYIRTNEGSTNDSEELRRLMEQQKASEGNKGTMDTVMFVSNQGEKDIDSSQYKFEENAGFAYDTTLSVKQVKRIVNHTLKYPPTSCEWTILKGRFKQGKLELLLENPENNNHNIWIDISYHSDCNTLTENILEGKLEIKISGSLKKLLRKFYS